MDKFVSGAPMTFYRFESEEDNRTRSGFSSGIGEDLSAFGCFSMTTCVQYTSYQWGYT